MVYGNRRSNYLLRNHASSPIGLSAISSISSIRLMRSIVKFQRWKVSKIDSLTRNISDNGV